MTGCTPKELRKLHDEFPESGIHWRAQTLTKDGSKAMALAYLDARDVMDRLDEICGPHNWQDRYEFDGLKTVCYLSIKVEDEWVTKADGSGDTDIEAEKGSISGAFKRSAVKWGIGRYLYKMPAPWVPCESYQANGKYRWRRWTADPWEYVRGKQPKQISSAEMKRGLASIDDELLDCRLVADVNKCAEIWQHITNRDAWTRDFKELAAQKFQQKREQLSTDSDNEPQTILEAG